MQRARDTAGAPGSCRSAEEGYPERTACYCNSWWTEAREFSHSVEFPRLVRQDAVYCDSCLFSAAQSVSVRSAESCSFGSLPRVH